MGLSKQYISTIYKQLAIEIQPIITLCKGRTQPLSRKRVHLMVHMLIEEESYLRWQVELHLALPSFAKPTQINDFLLIFLQQPSCIHKNSSK